LPFLGLLLNKLFKASNHVPDFQAEKLLKAGIFASNQEMISHRNPAVVEHSAL
jgi:hypothetical protein